MPDDLPTGEYLVLVTPPPPPAPNPEAPPVVQEDPANIPKKYRTDATSPLKAVVQTGSNNFTFDLEP